MDKGKSIIHTEPVIVLTLVGLILTGAILYYRAINFQRFIEPALAVLEPRTNFSSRLEAIANKEFTTYRHETVKVLSTRIMLHKSLFKGTGRNMVPPVVNSLARVMRQIFEDPWMSANIEMIMIKTSVPLDLPREARKSAYKTMRQQAETVMKAALGTEPILSTSYADRFAATTVFSRNPATSDWMIIDLVPSERLHIEMLERLGKYAHRPMPTN